MFIDLGNKLVNLNNVATISKECYSDCSIINFFTIDEGRIPIIYDAKERMEKDWKLLKIILEERNIECIPFKNESENKND